MAFAGALAGASSVWSAELRARLQVWARVAGFDTVGIAGLGDAEADDAERFRRWVEAGRAGEMEYLKRRDAEGRLLREDLRLSMPWARSVIVCALSYHADAPRSIDDAPEGAGWIARYAWSGRRRTDGTLGATDYHEELLERLRRVEAELHAQAACTTRCYVDTGPLHERGLAARAGVGWIGRNTCVIHPQLGSWLLLGVIVSSLDIPVEPENIASIMPDRCGSCTRCIDACPTDALLGSAAAGAPREMDATRCIAYLTIEKKGPIAEELREGMGRQVFGCDICQDVCPWNRRAPVRRHDGMEPRAELINPALEWLAAMDSREFREQFRGSPLERTGLKRMRRNVAIALGNGGDPRSLPVLDRWASAQQDEAATAKSTPPPDDPVLREAAAWAAAKIRGADASFEDAKKQPDVC